MIINLNVNEQEASYIVNLLGNQPNSSNTFVTYNNLKLQVEEQLKGLLEKANAKE